MRLARILKVKNESRVSRLHENVEDLRPARDVSEKPALSKH